MAARAPVRCVALLRAVNVGARQVPMERLRLVAEAVGGREVETYLRSGNVVLSVAATEVAGLPEVFGSACAEAFGFEIPIVVRTGTEMAAVVERNPFAARAVTTRLHVAFLESAPAPDAFAGLPADEGEELVLVGSELYLLLPGGVGRSRLATALGRRGRASGTMRNWATVGALAARSAG